MVGEPHSLPIHQNPDERHWILTLVWALCTPEIILLILGPLVRYFDFFWRRFPDSLVLKFLDRIATGAAIVTIVGGFVLTGIAGVLVVFYWRLRAVPTKRKVEAVCAFGLSLIACLWAIFVAAHVWGG